MGGEVGVWGTLSAFCKNFLTVSAFQRRLCSVPMEAAAAGRMAALLLRLPHFDKQLFSNDEKFA